MSYKFLKVKGKDKPAFRHTIELSIYSADGELKSFDKVHNLIPTEGLVEFLKLINGQSSSATKYIGLGTATYTPVATETGATVSGNTAEWVGYSESTRPAWTIPSITTNTVDNSASLAVFTSTSTATLKNVFLITDSTKGGTAGKLFSILTLPSARSLIPTDVIKIQFGLTVISQ